MALTEKHRNRIYQHLAPEWGEEVTEAFLSQFPAREGEEPITRDYLRAELGDLRGELRGEIAELRGEMHQLGSRLAGLIVGVTSLLVAVIAVATTVVVAAS